MTSYHEDPFLVSFESMGKENQFGDSSNQANIYSFYMMGYGQHPQNYLIGLEAIDEDYDVFNYPHFTQMSYHILYQI